MNLNLSSCSFQERGTYLLLTTFKFSLIVSNEETISIFGAILDNNKSIENVALQNCNCERIFNAVRKEVSTLQLLDISSSVISFKSLISIVANNTNI